MSTQYIDRNTLLLLRGEAVADAGWYKRQITNKGVAASTEQSRFGGKSLKFDGSAYLLVTPCAFGDRDFTIDWWEYVTSEDSHARFSSSYTLDAGVSSYGGLLIGYEGELVFASSYPVGNAWDLVSSYPMLNNTLNAWVHWAVVRSGNTLTSYRNGVAFAATPIEGEIGYSPSIQMAVGNYRFGDPSLFIGYIDEFRISDVARWTEDFTPPDERYAFALITDRTEADVFAVKGMAEAIKAGIATPEQVQQYLNVHQKGAYTPEDLNRVEAAVQYVATRLLEYGYLEPLPFVERWTVEDKPNERDWFRYFSNVAAVRNAITVWASTPEAPNSVVGFDVNKANDLEKILVDVDQILNQIRDAWYFSGDLYSAEV